MYQDWYPRLNSMHLPDISSVDLANHNSKYGKYCRIFRVEFAWNRMKHPGNNGTWYTPSALGDK